MSEKKDEGEDISYLLPMFLLFGSTLAELNAHFTRFLTYLDDLIARAEREEPDLPELTLLKRRRSDIRAQHRALLEVDAWVQEQQLPMEAGYAAKADISGRLDGKSR
jgi:hypothetical protein